MALPDFLVRHGAIATRQHAADWREAVRCAVDLLAAAGAAEPGYFDAIVEATRMHGPYYVIAPGIAMPHARGVEGLVHGAGFSLVTLDAAVAFGNAYNDPVDIVLCICAPDGKKLNEEVIVEVMELFESEENVARIRAARSPADLIQGFGWGGPA